MKNKQDLSNEEILELGLFVSHATLLQDEKQNKRHRHQPVKKERFKIFEWGEIWTIMQKTDSFGISIGLKQALIETKSLKRY